MPSALVRSAFMQPRRRHTRKVPETMVFWRRPNARFKIREPDRIRGLTPHIGGCRRWLCSIGRLWVQRRPSPNRKRSHRLRLDFAGAWTSILPTRYGAGVSG